MKDLFDSIKESLLDDTDDFLNKMDKVVGAAWLEKNATGDYKIKDKKSTLGLTITGRLIIDGFTGETIPVTIWSVKKGDVYIVNCPNLKTINGLFTERPLSLDGGLYIENCPKLMSLEGCPPIVDSFSCVGNRSIKSLVGAPEHVFGNCHIMKNGKKFTEEQIKAVMEVTKRINCNDEDEIANITEALTEPHLLKLAEYLKTKNRSFRGIFGNDYAWDKITSKDVLSFEHGFTDEAKKACNMILYSRKNGMIVTFDRNGNYRDIFKGKYHYDISDSSYRFGLNGNMTTNEILDELKYASEIIVIYFTHAMTTYDLQRDRRASREGMITNTEWQNREIARENIKRYKKIVAQNRANRDKDYEEIDKQVESIILRVLKASQISHRDPNKISAIQVQRLNEWIYDEVRYSSSTHTSYGKTGLLRLYNTFTDYLADVKKGSSYTFQIEGLEKVKVEIKDTIKKIDEELKSLGL